MFAGRGFDLASAQARLAAAMKAEGLPFVARDRAYDTRLAQELATWAVDAGKPEIHPALFRAVFAAGLNAADRPALVAIAAGVGLDADEAQAVLTERRMRARVDADWQRARALGVTGVPTYVAGRQGIVGAQPYEVLERFAQAAGAVRRSPAP
jgi:predicted DsbA family dithiol-disulfide isomerase